MSHVLFYWVIDVNIPVSEKADLQASGHPMNFLYKKPRFLIWSGFRNGLPGGVWVSSSTCVVTKAPHTPTAGLRALIVPGRPREHFCKKPCFTVGI